MNVDHQPCISRGLFGAVLYLGPGSDPPQGGAGHPVAGPPALGPLPAAVLGVDGAVGAVLGVLHAAHRPDLETQAATGPRTVLPLLRDPPEPIQTSGGEGEFGTVVRATWP